MLKPSEKYILYIFFIICTLFIGIENKKYTLPFYNNIKNDLPFVLFGISTLYNIYKKGKLNISSLLLDKRDFLLYSIFIYSVTIYIIVKKM